MAVNEVNGVRSTLSGLSEGEAREFNRIFVLSFIIFTGIAVVAHFLAWMWRPWGGNYAHTSMLIGHAATLLHPLQLAFG